MFQTGLYIFSHWVKCIREGKELKPIIPIVYYQGKKKWKIKSLADLFTEYSNHIKVFIPEINHVFIALHSLSDEKIEAIRNKLMASAVMAQKKAFDVMKLAEDLEKIFRLFPIKADKGNFLKTIIVYLVKYSEVPKSEWVKAVETIPADIKENLMTTYSWIKEEGKLEGKLEGEKIGIQKNKTQVILKGFDRGLPINLLSEIADLNEKEIRSILKKHDRL